MWILGKSYFDLPFIILPGLAALLVIKTLPLTYFTTTTFIIIYFLSKCIIEHGHIYSTLWRTLFSKEERQANSVYLITPLILFTGISIWTLLRVPYFNFIIFLTFVWHNIQQYYGVQKWYQFLNKRNTKWSDLFFNLLAWFPIIISPFNPINFSISSTQLFIFDLGIYIYGAIVFTWILYEIVIFFKGYNEINRILAILAPCFLIAVACFSTKIDPLPFFVGHGLPYLVIMAFSMNKIKPKQFNSLAKSLFLILLVATIFGLFQRQIFDILNYVTSDYIFLYSIDDKKFILRTFLFRILLIPLLCHQYWDGFLWKKKHNQAHLIYSHTVSQT